MRGVFGALDSSFLLLHGALCTLFWLLGLLHKPVLPHWGREGGKDVLLIQCWSDEGNFPCQVLMDYLLPFSHWVQPGMSLLVMLCCNEAWLLVAHWSLPLTICGVQKFALWRRRDIVEASGYDIWVKCNSLYWYKAELHWLIGSLWPWSMWWSEGR